MLQAFCFRPRAFLAIILTFWSILPGSSHVLAQHGVSDGEWHAYGGDRGGSRYTALDQINRDNVDQLEVAWIWKSDNFNDVEFRNSSTPLMVGGILYFTAGSHRNVVAVDAGTGKMRWMWAMEEGQRWQEAPRRNSGRGVSYWTDGTDARIFVVTPGFQLVALDALTGIPEKDFGINGVVDLFTQLDLDYEAPQLIGAIGNSSPPTIAGNSVVVGPALRPGGRSNIGNVKADIMAFDAVTGDRKWVFHTVPREGEPGYETWLDGSADQIGNAGVWGLSASDEELGYVYLNVEAATNDVYGGHRPGNNLFSSSLVCLDAETGEMVWYQQLVHHDIWDYDMPPHPILMDINVDGREINAIVQLSKQAFAYVYDRETGEPVWPINELPVGTSDVPGEWTAATQPIPSKPPAFDVQGVTEDDLIDFTPALREAAIEAIKQFRTGPLYMPVSLSNAEDGTRGTIMVPGFGGGANWEGGAADSELGLVFVGSNTNPTMVGLQPPSIGTTDADYNLGGSLALPMISGLPLLKPPYGRISAYNMNTGEMIWQIPNGDTPEEIAENPALAGLDFPATGIASHAGLLVTSTLLFAGEGNSGRPIFRALDKLTGEEVWRTDIPIGPQQGLPMSYMHEGRQYIAFFSSNGEEGIPASLVVYALSD